MAKRSLFAILSRSPWWVSVLISVALFMLVRQFMPDYAALASTLPFLGIAGYAGWRQSRVPNPERVGEALAALRAMSWQEFAAKMEAAFRSEGMRSSRSPAAPPTSNYARAAVSRWRAANAGRWRKLRIEPLHELLLANYACSSILEQPRFCQAENRSNLSVQRLNGFRV